MIRLALLLAALALPARAEEIVLGLSQDEVAITATFDGSDILVFGAVRREAPPPGRLGPLEVIVAVSGPLAPVTVRRKSRRAGIWVNSGAFEIPAAPSFYAIATTAPLDAILGLQEDRRHAISIPRAIRALSPRRGGEEAYFAALLRIREAEGLYRREEGAVDLSEETLFRTSLALPADLVEGNYTARIFLTRGGRVIDRAEAVIGVQKVGVGRWLYNLAHERPPVYGLLSLLLAVGAGWAASAAFAGWRR